MPEFRRGTDDPLDTLKIGKGPQKWIPLVEKALSLMGIEYDKDNYSTYVAWWFKPSKTRVIYLTITAKNPKDEGWYYRKGFSPDSDLGPHRNPKEILRKILDENIENSKELISDFRAKKVKIEDSIDKLENLIENEPKIRELLESIEFKRADDPRKSIGIGSSYTRRINNKKIARKILLKDDDEIRKMVKESGILNKYSGRHGYIMALSSEIFLAIKEISEFIVDRGHSVDYATITFGGLYGIFDPESTEGLEDMYDLIEVLESIGYLFDPLLKKKPLSQWDNIISKNIDDYIYD